MKVTLDELRSFIMVVERGSITGAAASLEQTISGASRTLRRLEEKLGATLLRRTTRRLELTEEGDTLLQSAREVIGRVEAMEEQMRARRNRPAGRLRVDAASPFMLHVVVPLVAGYRERHPEVELELDSNEGIVDLLEHRTDVAIRIGRLKDSTLHARLLGNSRLRVLASPAYLAAHGTPRRVADLASHALLGFNQPESLKAWPLPDAKGRPLQVRAALASSSGETLRQLALEGAGIVCLSDFMTHADRRAGRLQQLFVRQTLDMRQPVHAVYYRNTALSSRIASFIDYLVGALGSRGFTED